MSPTDDDFKTRIMGWRLAGSRKHYADYQDPNEDALKYMTADFSRFGARVYKSLVERLVQQSKKIQELESKLEALRRQ